jgi:predicted XRE-type DNA-binding protein
LIDDAYIIYTDIMKHMARSKKDVLNCKTLSFDESYMLPYTNGGSPSGLELYKLRSSFDWISSTDLRAKLPRLNQDILTLYFEKEKTQAQIAEIVGQTQGNISAAILKSFKYLKWMADARTINPDLTILKIRETNKDIVRKIIDCVRAGIMRQTEISAIVKTNQSNISVWLRRLNIHLPMQTKKWTSDRLQKYHSLNFAKITSVEPAIKPFVGSVRNFARGRRACIASGLRSVKRGR